MQHHDQRTGRGLGHAEPVEHLAGFEPVIVLDRLLGDIGQHRIGAPEGHERHLAEEHRDLTEHVGGAQGDEERDHGHEPEREPNRRCAQRTGHRRARVLRQLVSEQAVDQGFRIFIVAAAVSAADAKRGEAGQVAEKADQRRAEHDQRERHAEEKDAEEGRRRERDHDRVLERAPADAHHGLEHDRQDGGFQPEE